MTILGLELASFNNYRLYGILSLFISESRDDHFPLPIKFFFSVTGKMSANIGETPVNSLNPKVHRQEHSYVSLRLWEDWPVRTKPSTSLARMPG